MPIKFKQNQDVTLKSLGALSPILVFSISWENKAKSGLLNRLTGEKHNADLDLSCVVYDQNDNRIDCVWYAQLASKCGSIRHKGDETVGAEELDDESISIDLNQLNETAETLFFVISAFSDNNFSQVEQAHWTLFDGVNKNELARYDFSPNDKSSAKIVMRLKKVSENGLTEWHVKAMDELATGQNIQEIFPELRSLLHA